MEERYLGLNGQDINKQDIPYHGTLEDYDRIYNSFGDELIWMPNKQFRWINNDVSGFLPIGRVFSYWRKK